MSGRALLLSLDFSTLPLIHTLYCWVLSKEVSSTIFKVFGMTRPGIEPRSTYSLQTSLKGLLSVANGLIRFQEMHDVTDLSFVFLYTKESYWCVQRKQPPDQVSKFWDKWRETLIGDVVETVCSERYGKYRKLEKCLRFSSFYQSKTSIRDYKNLLSNALRIQLACSVTVASTEINFIKLKPIKSFHKSTMMVDRLSLFAI